MRYGQNYHQHITKSKGQLPLAILFVSEQQFALSGCSHLPELAVALSGPIGVFA